jgi:hypothetical protein
VIKSSDQITGKAAALTGARFASVLGARRLQKVPYGGIREFRTCRLAQRAATTADHLAILVGR